MEDEVTISAAVISAFCGDARNFSVASFGWLQSAVNRSKQTTST